MKPISLIFWVTGSLFILFSCNSPSQTDLYGEWKGIDNATGESYSLILMVKNKAEWQTGNNHRLYGAWRIDTSASGKIQVDLKLFDPYNPQDLIAFEPMEIIESRGINKKLRMKNRIDLDRDCDGNNNISEAHLLYGYVRKIEYSYQEAPDLYFQNYKLIVIPGQLQVIIQNHLGSDRIIDKSYPITKNQFKKIAEDIEFVAVENDDFRLGKNCDGGTLEQIKYYGDCGIILEGMVYTYGHMVYGNVKPYIYAVESNIRELIPPDSMVFETANAIMDSMMVSANFHEKFLRSSLFNILGMMDEYISRFYISNGKPTPNYIIGIDSSDTFLIDYFEKSVNDYQQECPIDFEYTKKILPDGSINYNSVKLAKIINAFYTDINSVATLDSTIFDHSTKNDMLNYIDGAYRRFGIKKTNRIVIPNGYYKIKTIAQVLKKLGCTDVITYNVRSIPAGNSVIFKPDRSVRDRLNIKKILTEKDIQKDL